MPYQLDIRMVLVQIEPYCMVTTGSSREKAVTRSLDDLIYEKIIKNVVSSHKTVN